MLLISQYVLEAHFLYLENSIDILIFCRFQSGVSYDTNMIFGTYYNKL